jgi:hypothetical protein
MLQKPNAHGQQTHGDECEKPPVAYSRMSGEHVFAVQLQQDKRYGRREPCGILTPNRAP